MKGIYLDQAFNNSNLNKRYKTFYNKHKLKKKKRGLVFIISLIFVKPVVILGTCFGGSLRSL